jgi:hypothetical protein
LLGAVFGKKTALMQTDALKREAGFGQLTGKLGLKTIKESVNCEDRIWLR